MRMRLALLVLLAGLPNLVHPHAAAASDPVIPIDNGRGSLEAPASRVPNVATPTPAVRDRLQSRLDNRVAPEQALYFTHPEDVSVQGSHCVGLDCTGAEAFGFDTIRLKENNVRIKFQDTSLSAGFPFKSWSLVANDSEVNGRNMFALYNDSDGRLPFLIMDSAQTNSFYLVGENAGLGTSVPATKIHGAHSNSPTLRLEQTPAAGWSPYIWDVGGNEANFFVRDQTGGGQLAFRMLPGAGANAIVATSSGIGLGLATPAARFHLQHAAPTMQVTNTTSSATTFSLDANGNLTLSGLLFESSSRDAKENMNRVNPDAMLERVAELPIYEWNYKTDDPSTTHVGPVAEDFAAAFGLGKDDRHIAALDASGVALGAIQALARGNKLKDTRIAELEAKLGAQGAEIERLAAELKALLDRLETR